jgi:hypothetical protein
VPSLRSTLSPPGIVYLRKQEKFPRYSSTTDANMDRYSSYAIWHLVPAQRGRMAMVTDGENFWLGSGNLSVVKDATALMLGLRGSKTK